MVYTYLYSYIYLHLHVLSPASGWAHPTWCTRFRIFQDLSTEKYKQMHSGSNSTRGCTDWQYLTAWQDTSKLIIYSETSNVFPVTIMFKMQKVCQMFMCDDVSLFCSGKNAQFASQHFLHYCTVPLCVSIQYCTYYIR